ncbi:MAG: BamA/TamA family outer membrane protein [Elusimicrobiota bacterium]
MAAAAAALLVLCVSGGWAQAASVSSPTFNSIKVEHSGLLPGKQVDAALPIRAGDEYDAAKAALARESLLSLFHNNGFLEAVVASRIALQNGAADLSLQVVEGPLYRFGETRFAGLKRIREKDARRELPYGPGEAYVRSALFAAQSRLYGLGLFEDIGVRVTTTTGKTAEVVVRVKEKRAKWVKAGVGWGSEESERASVQFRHANFLRQAYTLNLTAIYSRIWLEYNGEFVNRYFLGSKVENRLQVSWRREDLRGYDIEKSAGQTSFGRTLAYGIRGSLAYKLQRSVLFNFNPGITAPANTTDLTSSVALLANRDTTDDPFFPTRGTLVQGRIERAGGVLGGDVHFNRASLDGAWYRGLWKKLTLAASARTGAIRQFGPASEVPVYERFFTGGANTIRGYRERGVGRVDDLGAPVGGNVLLGANIELRFPIFWRFWGAAFLDGGQVDPREGLVVPAHWKYGTGAGLRVRTPVGPLRLDWGYKLSRQNADDSDWRIHLSLGEAF